MRLPMALLLAAVAAPAAAQTHLVVVTGLAGEQRYGAAFHESAITLLDAARDRMGVPADHLMYFADRPVDPTQVTGRSTKVELTDTLRSLAARAGPEALVVIVLIGHGSARGDSHRLNLPGPDLTAKELGELLAAFSSQDVVVVNTASASGGWIDALSGPRRTVITATRSGVEREETRFPLQFARAFADEAADTDKNGRISFLEAFRYAKREVERFFENANLLPTEHAMLDDNGDGAGSLDPDPQMGDGAAAATLYLDAPVPVAADPVLADLMSRRDSLERALTALRARRDRIDAAQYERDLETLLLAIARVGRAIRERDGTE